MSDNSLPIFPTGSNGVAIPASGVSGRTRKVQAPAWRGSFVPETYFLGVGAVLVLAEEAITDQYRSYSYTVRNPASTALWSGTASFSSTAAPAVFPAAATPADVNTSPTASRVTLWYDAANTSYKITNSLGVPVYVTLVRIG